MLYMDGVGGLIVIGLWIFCFIDVLLTPDGACRNLPKLAWVFIVLLFPPIGPIAWLIAGHPWDKVNASVRTGSSNRFPEYDRPGRYVPSNPDDDEDFLASLRQRAEEQRRRAKDPPREKDDKPDAPA